MVNIGFYITCKKLTPFAKEKFHLDSHSPNGNLILLNFHSLNIFLAVCLKSNHLCFNSSDLTTNDPSAGIFSPVLSSGLCRYEVAYTNTSLVGMNTVCFMIW